MVVRRVVTAFAFTALLALLGAIFWPFLLGHVLTPLALVAWLLLRLFVLSIDQRVYWLALLVGLPFVVMRFLLQVPMRAAEAWPERDFEWAPPGSLAFWRGLLAQAARGDHDRALVRQELTDLVVAWSASEHHGETTFMVRDALERREIPLPPSIHDFLFPDPPRTPPRAVPRVVRRLRSAPRRLVRRWTGKDAAEQQRAIARVLLFLEDSLEVNRDDDRSRTPRH